MMTSCETACPHCGCDDISNKYFANYEMWPKTDYLCQCCYKFYEGKGRNPMDLVFYGEVSKTGLKELGWDDEEIEIILEQNKFTAIISEKESC